MVRDDLSPWLRPPRLPAHLVPRDRLLRRLDAISRVTVLEALTGHGRTTLAAVWAERRRAEGDRVVWIHAADLGSGGALERCLQAGLAEVAHDHDERRTIVVVDELDSIADPQVGDLLCDTLARDRRLHLLASVRTPHPLAAEARRRDLGVDVVSGDDLSVTAEDIVVFAEAWGHRVTPDGARRLHRLLGGWLLPLRLVLDATPPDTENFATEIATEFFEHTVLPQVLDEGAKALAARVALTTPVTPATVAAAATGVGCSSSDAERHLLDLQRVGILQRDPRATDRRWRIPTLVRRSLVAAFERSSPEEQARCHRTVAEQLQRTGAPLDAVLGHARHGEHWALLSSLWEEHALQLALDHPAAAVGAYASVPDAALAQRPVLAVPRAITAALASSPDDPGRATVLRSYAEVGRAHRFPAAAARTPGELVDVQTAVLVARRAEGDLAGAREVAVETWVRLEAMSGSAEAPLRAAWLALQRGMTELMIGDLAAATSWCTRAVDVAPEGGGDFIASHGAGLVALVHALDGDTATAARWLAVQQRHAVDAPWLDRVLTAPARIAATLLAIDRLDQDEAEARLADLAEGAAELWPFVVLAGTRHALFFGEPMRMLAQVEHVAALHRRHLTGGGLARRVVDRCRADLLISLGEANQAHGLVADLARPTATAARSPWLAAPAARLQLAAGDPARARRIASAWIDADATSRRDRVELLMLEAAAAAATGEDELAVARLEQAHDLAREAGLQYAGLLLPGTLPDRLSASSRGDAGAARRPYPDTLRLVRLSPREAAVLDLLHQHSSLASIARRLTVSVNTVKKQTVSIYAKLGVHDRASALLEARRLGLCNPTADEPRRTPARRPHAVATDRR